MQIFQQQIAILLATSKLFNYKFSSENVTKYIAHLCKFYNISFVFNREFSNTVTFKNAVNIDDSSDILWELPNARYKIDLNENTCYDESAYDVIVKNAIILLNINKIYLKNYVKNQDTYIVLAILACLLMLNNHIRKRTNNTYFINMKISDFAEKCFYNMYELFQTKDFELSILSASISNIKVNHKCNEYITLGINDKNTRHSITNKVKHMLRNERVIKISVNNPEFSARKIAVEYEKEYHEKISYSSVIRILK